MYSGYGIGFDSLSEFLLTDGSVDKTVIIFRVDVSSSVHTDNKRNVLILDKGPKQGLDNATLTSKAKYPINFTELGKKKLCLHNNESNSFLFFNASKICQIKAKDSEKKDYAPCLGNISRDFTINNMTKTGLKESVKFFSVDYNPIDS